MGNRRNFIKNVGLGTIGLSLISDSVLANENIKKITILHTNDMHSHIEPFKSGKYKGLGGMAQRASIINEIRKKEKNVLLLDAGDIFQGTPYFNYYGGELEFKLMSKMNYDAATLGNHDFDNGINGLERQLKHELNCDLFICLSHLGCEYKSKKISDTVLAQQTRDIDLIIGGHTHTFLKKPKIITNLRKEKVIINQVGFGGINIGKIDFIFKQNKRDFNVKKSSIFVKKNKKTT